MVTQLEINLKGTHSIVPRDPLGFLEVTKLGYGPQGLLRGLTINRRVWLPETSQGSPVRDMKLKFRIERFKSAKMVIFAQWCRGTLARAHARSGEPPLISSYLGEADTFDQAIAAFAVTYADQVERDYERFTKAVHQGKMEAPVEPEDLQDRAAVDVAIGRRSGRLTTPLDRAGQRRLGCGGDPGQSRIAPVPRNRLGRGGIAGREQLVQRQPDGLHDVLGLAAVPCGIGVVAMDQSAAVIAARNRQVAPAPLVRRTAADPAVGTRRLGVEAIPLQGLQDTRDGLMMSHRIESPGCKER